jgi:hypothetical protein
LVLSSIEPGNALQTTAEAAIASSHRLLFATTHGQERSSIIIAAVCQSKR